MGLSAMATLTTSPEWPRWLLIRLCFDSFGATAVGWNGVFLAEVARIAPRLEGQRSDRRLPVLHLFSESW
jgi:hypothetical protein